MRSYKDCLIEYLEERSYTELDQSWYNYFKSSIATTSITNFQIIENLPPVEQEVDFSFYADVLPTDSLVAKFQLFSVEKISNVYKSLVSKLIEGEYLYAKNTLNASGLNWKTCRQVLEYPIQPKYKKFTDVLVDSLKNSNIDAKAIKEYVYEEYKNAEVNYLNVIEDFFEIENYHLDVPKHSMQAIASETESIQINFDSRFINTEQENNWSSKVNHASSDFFQSESELVEELNSKAKISGIRVEGELNGYHALNVDTGSWWSEEVVQQLFEEEGMLNKRIDYKDKTELVEKLSRKITAFHCIRQFDLTLTIFNEFKEEEAELLKSISFSIFPFHFSSKLDHFKWIEINEEGNLVIRLKSKVPQTSIIGADLKIYKS